MSDSVSAESSNPAITALRRGVVIPACPLALTAERRLDERRQRALCRYYAASRAGGLAVGAHTTQFAIRNADVGLFEPVLTLAAEEMDRADAKREGPMVRVAGICGSTSQAVREANLARSLGYHAGLVHPGSISGPTEPQLIDHLRAVSKTIPLFGFYLQPAAGGRVLSYRFWREFVELEHVVAIKIAPFNRYQTLDVVRAVAESGRDDIALYTGNDDNIVLDLVTPYPIMVAEERRVRRIVGGLLGHWSVWTQRAVKLHERCRSLSERNDHVPVEVLCSSVEITDCNAAFFDAANGFSGCISGLHEVLRRQGLLEGIWCLDRSEGLSPGQFVEIDRVCRFYPHLADDDFVKANRDSWLSG